jgi:hypothetical protein
MGACFWLSGSDLCSACLFPAIRLSGPQIDDARTLTGDGPVTLAELCATARIGDPDQTRWMWAMYGKERAARLETTIRRQSQIAA